MKYLKRGPQAPNRQENALSNFDHPQKGRQLQQMSDYPQGPSHQPQSIIMQPQNSGGPTKGYIGENINEVEGLFESISSQVNEAKRKKDVCMFWMKN